MSLPPLSALRAFEAAIRNGSLSAAGRELNVTHAAIAQQVRRLEDWFGLALIVRAGRGVAPTDDGARLAAGLSRGFSEISATVAAMAADQAARPLHISVTPNFASNWLIPRLGAFRTAHPEIELFIDPSSRVADLTKGEVDVALRYGMGNWEGAEARRLVSIVQVMVAASELLEGRDIQQPRDLLDLPWIQERGTEEWRVWLKSRGVEEFEHHNIIHLPPQLIVEAVRRGQGVGMSPRVWFEEDIKEGRIVALFEAERAADLGYYVVTRRGSVRKQAKVFADWCIAQSKTGAD